MLTGINHLTLATNCLTTSFNFYVQVVGFTPRARWQRGAYLSLGELWLCLSLDPASPAGDYTHYAFSISEENIPLFREKLLTFGAIEWKSNQSEGESIYFLDPDGHKLEAHCGTLESRLNTCRQSPYEGMIFFDK